LQLANAQEDPAWLGRIRTAVMVVVLLGVTGSLTELLLIGHDEDAWQLIPIALLGIGVMVAGWNLLRPGRSSVRVLRLLMVAFVVAGAMGAVLHYQANVEFQREMDPSLTGTALLWTVLRAKSPPALSPGLMVQLGLLGLIYSWGHPAMFKGDRK
jgi:hypothetical protein